MDKINLNVLFDKYNEALTVIKNRFDLMYDDFSNKGDDNPIEFIECRIKKIDSIAKKLVKKSLPFTTDNIEKGVNDIIGVRIVCSFLTDLNIIIKEIEKMQENGEFVIIDRKDYVENPKENGYSSYHIIIKKPIMIRGEKKDIKAEIQIRTIAMDMASCLEHKLMYKKERLNSVYASQLSDTYKFCNKLDNDINKLIGISDNSFDNSDFKEPAFMKDREYERMMFKYKTALDIMDNKLKNLKEAYEKEGLMNPIEHVKKRLKDNKAIIRKLMLSDKDISMDNVFKYVNDIAGVRVVCSFLSDLEELKEIIKNDPELIIVKEKDYVTNPKENGYRGYHLIVGVPFYLTSGFTLVKVEIQIRTIAMEMWASLEQKICYHKKTDESTKEELKRLSSVISNIDDNVNEIVTYSKKNNNIKKRVKKKINN